MIREKYRNFALSVFFFYLISSICLAMRQNRNILVNVGFVLDDLTSRDAKIWLSCSQMAISDFYTAHPHHKTRLVLKTKDSKKSVVGAAAAADDLIKNSKVQAVLGPVTSMQTIFVISLGRQAHVPIISFAATSPALSSLRSSYFFQFAQNGSTQVKALSAIVKAFGWRQVVPIFIDNEFGDGVMPFLTDALHDIDVRIPYRSAITPLATDDQILEELYKLIKMHTRVFIIHMTTDLSSRLFSCANKLGMMSEGYVWLTTTEIPNSLKSLKPSVSRSMEGILGVQTYIPRTNKLEEFKKRWKLQFQKDNPTIINARLDVFGLWLYDAVHALAMAVEEVGTTGRGFHNSNSSFSSTDIETLEMGPKLCQPLSSLRFEGMIGDFCVVDGQLQTSTFRIVNINGGGAREIGFWTSENGLVKELGSSANATQVSGYKSNLGPIIWPGDSLSVPKGWEFPTRGKKLRIGVPMKLDFTEFLQIMKDSKTGTIIVTGFCVDIFKAVVEVLPYALPYELIPFVKPDGTSAGTDGELCYQVFLGKFDAVLGDIALNADMSVRTEFTTPYREANLVMVVPVKDMNRKNVWIHWIDTILRPCWNLWLTTACFSVFSYFVLWYLEHPNNDEFGGSFLHQVGTFALFAISAIFWAHVPRIQSTSGKLVMAAWICMMMTLIQSYQANQIKKPLTAENVKPVTDINDLLRKGENVGYITGSYTYHILKDMGFGNSRLKDLGTMKEIDEALSKGSAEGGISAFVDETLHVKLFIAKYCEKYTMTEPFFQTGGFGYVFSKHSPLLPGISEAISYLKRGQKLKDIENKWFNYSKSNDNCPDKSGAGLGPDSFWIVFLIVGLVSVFALVTKLIDNNRNVLVLFLLVGLASTNALITKLIEKHRRPL